MLEDVLFTDVGRILSLLLLLNPDKEIEEQQTREEDKLEKFVSPIHIVNLPGEPRLMKKILTTK